MRYTVRAITNNEKTMKKRLSAVMAAAGLFGLFAVPANAALLGSFDIVNALANPSVVQTVNMFDLKPTSITSLNTPIDDNDLSVIRYKNALYFVDTNGIRKQTIGSSTASTLRSGSAFEQKAGDGQFLLINNTSTKRSFIYNVEKKKTLTFTPRVGLVTAADFALDGRVMVMVAKNLSGKLKVFISQGAPNTVRQYDLPTGMKDCSNVAVSPKGTKAALLCEKTFGGEYVVTMNIDGQTLGRMYRKTSSTFLAHSLVWLTERKLVVGGYNSTDPNNLFHVAYKMFVVNSNGAISSTQLLSANPDLLNPSPTTVLGIDSQLQRYSSSAFYYTYSFLGTDAVDTAKSYFGASIGFFDTASNTDRILVADEKYNVLTEQPNN